MYKDVLSTHEKWERKAARKKEERLPRSELMERLGKLNLPEEEKKANLVNGTPCHFFERLEQVDREVEQHNFRGGRVGHTYARNGDPTHAEYASMAWNEFKPNEKFQRMFVACTSGAPTTDEISFTKSDFEKEISNSENRKRTKERQKERVEKIQSIIHN